MTWTVYGKPYAADADLTDTSISQALKFDYPVILKAVRVWLIIKGNPTFTSLNMKIYSDDAEQATRTPKKLLYTSSNSQTKADIITLAHGVKEIYFEFANINLAAETYYNFVINASGYSGASDSSHIAWRIDFPAAVYIDGVTEDDVATYPLCLYPILARFDEA
jgi:hypothetical protein